MTAETCLPAPISAAPAKRHQTIAVSVGGVIVGGGAPIVVQSMTNTDTADIDGTVQQVAALVRAGSELVRITVDRDEAAAAVPHIRDKLMKRGITVPLVGDFHYIGHTLLADHPACAEALAKYRINPGNVGFKDKRDRQFSAIVEMAIRHNKTVRIGANWGSLDQELLTHLMDINAAAAAPLDARSVTREALVRSALLSADRAVEIGLPKDKIILSAKVSGVQDLISVYRMLAARSDYALHLGLTEAGMGSKGIVASSAGMAVLLQEGIGDTIRVSLSVDPVEEVRVAYDILRALGLRHMGPEMISCPSCGSTNVEVHELAEIVETRLRGYKEHFEVAVMGCAVNGPGEAGDADFGIAGGRDAGHIYAHGEVLKRVPQDQLVDEMFAEVDRWIAAGMPRPERGRRKLSLPVVGGTT